MNVNQAQAGFNFSSSKGSRSVTFSNNTLTAAAPSERNAWHQVQTEQPLLTGSSVQFKIDQMPESSVNGYGIGTF